MRVALPLARPIVALVGFFAFVSNWTNFFLPYVMFYSDRQYPLPVGLEYLVSSTSAFNPVAGTESPVLRPELAMATLVAIAPVFIIFLFAQRALVTGMLAGATKRQTVPWFASPISGCDLQWCTVHGDRHHPPCSVLRQFSWYLA